MKQRQLGNSGPILSEIGLGTWAIGGPWDWGWGAQDDQESIRTIHKALDLGINWIDTAAVYGLGHAEEVIAKALGDLREEIYLATKCGLIWDSRGRVRNDNRPESIFREAEVSLRRLNTDYIDLYQIHWPDPNTPVEDSWEAMLRLQEQGKVRYIGVSNFDVPLLEKCNAIAHVTSLQPPYNLIRREIEEDILPWCKVHQTGLVVYSPMQSGLLTGKFDPSRLAKDDWRRKSPFFREPQLGKGLRLVEELKPIAEKYGKTLSQFSIAWVLMNRTVTSAIVGARHPEQVEEIAGGAGWKIKQEDMKRIEQISEEIFNSV